MQFKPLYNYIGFFLNNIYYKYVHINGKENIPAKDEAVIIAANHQNAINDPLALEYAFKDRTINLFAHGNLFRNPIMNKFLRSIHVIPAYRMRTDGEESLGKNYDEFSKVEEMLFKGEWAGIFPEATNMTGHWLGEFSLGYLRMAFAAAEKCNFEKDVKILPVSIHYDNYHRFRHSLCINIAPAVSLSQFYDLYKTKPRTAQRQANQLIRSSIEQGMLNVTDLDNYDAIDYIRNTYGIKYCASKGKWYSYLPDKLKTDQMLINELEKAYADNTEYVQDIYNNALILKEKTRNAGIRDWVITNDMSKAWIMIYLLCIFIPLFPVFIYSLIPNIIAYLAPIPLCKKFDKIGGPFVMFKGGVQIILTTLIVCPIIHLVPFITMICMASNWIGYLWAIVWILTQSLMLIFGWEYYNHLKKFISLIRFRILKKTPKMQEIISIRSSLWGNLDKIASNNCK